MCIGCHYIFKQTVRYLGRIRFIRYALYTMESSDSDVECGVLFGQIRPYQLEPYAARRPEGEEVAAGVDVVRVGNTDW